MASFTGTTLMFLKKTVRFSDIELNAELIGTNFKSQKWKTIKLVCPFLIPVCHFETSLITLRFLLFLDNFGRTCVSVSVCVSVKMYAKVRKVRKICNKTHVYLIKVVHSFVITVLAVVIMVSNFSENSI